MIKLENVTVAYARHPAVHHVSGVFVAQSASIVSSAAVFVLGTVFFFGSFHDVRPF